MSKNEKIRKAPQKIRLENGVISIFTENTVLPSDRTLEALADIFMIGFNNPPWDVYEWKYTPEKARKEFKKIILTVLSNKGSFITLEIAEKASGFQILTDLSIFSQRLYQTNNFKKLPRDFNSPYSYLKTISKLIGVETSRFESVAYLADIAVDETCRGKGLSKALLETGLKSLKETGKSHVMAWTVNPIAARILVQAGFNRIPGIGGRGEGIDFLVKGRIWYATLDLPAENRKTIEGKDVISEHYVQKL
jgi:ribosomal protein S18 acetylase RimI-like enzyme